MTWADTPINEMKLMLCFYLCLLIFKNVSATFCHASDFMDETSTKFSLQECVITMRDLSKIEGLELIEKSISFLRIHRCFTFIGVLKNGNEKVFKGCIPEGYCPFIKETFDKLITMSELKDEMHKKPPPPTVPESKPVTEGRFHIGVSALKKVNCVECEGDMCNSGTNKEKLFIFKIVLLLFVFLLI